MLSEHVQALQASGDAIQSLSAFRSYPFSPFCFYLLFLFPSTCPKATSPHNPWSAANGEGLELASSGASVPTVLRLRDYHSQITWRPDRLQGVREKKGD